MKWWYIAIAALTIYLIVRRCIAADRHAPIECDLCLKLVPPDEYDTHVAAHYLGHDVTP